MHRERRRHLRIDACPGLARLALLARVVVPVLLMAASTWMPAAHASEPAASLPAAPAAAFEDGAPELRLAVERDYPPFVYAGPDGQARGLSIEMLRLVQERTGLRFRELPAQPLAVLLDDMRARRADVITSLRPTPERSQYLLFTRPYVSVPAILVVRENRSVPRGRDPLKAFRGRPVAVGAGYAVEGAMKAAHPEVDWQPVTDDAVALRGVADGRFDAAVADAASVAYVIQRDALGGLRSAGRVGFDYELSLAVRSDRPALRDRIDAAIQSISQTDRQVVVERWLNPLDITAISRPLPGPAFIGLGLVGGGALLLALVAWQGRGRRRHA